MGRQVEVAWQEDAATLEQMDQAETDKQNRMRLHALWLIGQGRTVTETAAILGVGRRTVQTWLGWYRQGGVAEVLSHRHGGEGGPERRLTSEQEAELVEKAKKGELRTIWDGVAWAEQAHGVEYTYQGMRWVFERLGLKKKVPRGKSPQASAQEQTAWKKRGLARELVKAGVSEAGQIAFADEMRVGLIGEVRRRWVPQGYKLEQVVEYEYEWAYLTLAVNGLTGTLLWDWTETMKGAAIAPVVSQWQEAGIEAVVWDGAQGHRGEAYQDVSVARIEQPAYSPQLNPAERVFQYLRNQIEGQLYGSVAAKKRAVEAELKQLAHNPARLKSLTGWDWIQNALQAPLAICAS